MALLFEVADYSLNQLKSVPEEISVTSRLRQWGVPGEVHLKSPVMATTVYKNVGKRGISSTLYDPRRIEDEDQREQRVIKLTKDLQKIDKNIGLAACVPESKCEKLNTPYDIFDCRSPLAYHLNPVGFNHEIVTDLLKFDSCNYTIENFVELPLRFIAKDSLIIPDWQLSDEEQIYLSSISVTKDSCRDLEKCTQKQSESKLWLFSRRHKITSSNAHKVYIRKKIFESLLPIFMETDRKETPRAVSDALIMERI